MSEQRPTDADLIAHLRRRSSDPRADSELFVRDFIAEVGSRIDAGTSPVPVRRWPALAGLAGAAAIVLVLVVALPRLGPGGPSPSPSLPDAPPSTISTIPVHEFAARVVAGELRGETVLVNAAIASNPALFLRPCPPPGPCYLGDLVGTDPLTSVQTRWYPTIEGQGTELTGPEINPVWAWWDRPRAPLEGVLVLSVEPNGNVFFVGRNPPEEIATVLSEIPSIDFDAVPLDEIRVVPAWLTGTENTHICGEGPVATPPGGLPSHDGCGDRTWLTPSRYRVDPDNHDMYQMPPDSLIVQNGAYRQFAPNPSVDNRSAEPRGGVWIIARRLSGGGCYVETPCWQWEVVGRVTINGDTTQAQPLATPAPSASTLPAPPTPSASPSAPPTPSFGELPALTAGQFAESLRAGEIDRQHVLVEGGIVPGPPVPRALCPPSDGGYTCYFGELEGTQPPITVSSAWIATTASQATATFDEPGIKWRHWWFPEAPVRGLLLLSVRGGTVEYLGRVEPNADSLTWLVSEANAVEPGSISPDAILLVDGWLTGLGGLLDCAAPPDDLIAGLPERWCNNSGWLMDDASRMVASADDRASGIELQDHAYHEFAPAPDPQSLSDGDGEPRKGTYALAPSLEGWCGGNTDPPCWQWRVVGRVAEDLSAVDPRTIECRYPAAGFEPPSPPPRTSISVRDDTGNVEHCIAGLGPTGSSGVLVEIEVPTTRIFNVSWPGTTCDDSAAFTFRQTDTGYDLLGETQGEPCPDDSPVRHQVLILLETAVAVDSVHVTMDGAIGVLVPPPSTPNPDTAIIPCTTSERHATVLDQTGYIDACRTVEGTVPVESITLLDHFDRDIALRILWNGSSCDDAPIFRLYQSGTRVTLEGELYGEPCGPENVPYEVQLILNSDVFAQVIDASMRRVAGPAPTPSNEPPMAIGQAETDAGLFELTLSAGRASYATDEPIDINAELVWHGPPGSTVEIFAARSSDAIHAIHFGWEQLAGELRVGAPIRNICDPYVMRSGEPLSATFAKEGGTFGDREHDEFWRDYFASPELRLPPGRYRIGARVEFALSAAECRTNNDLALAFITINVTE